MTIDEIADTLNLEDRPFVVMQEDGKGGLEMRIRYTYRTGIAMMCAIADIIMDDYVPFEGYTVHNDLRNSLERTMELNKAQPDDELVKNNLAALRNLFSKITTKLSPEEYFEKLRDGDLPDE